VIENISFSQTQMSRCFPSVSYGMAADPGFEILYSGASQFNTNPSPK
jgi:hypothetical protein